jgi:protein disulfide-isomerase
VSLTAETFQTLVTMTQEPWFIKFYAPWCHHCQAMATNWQQLAKEMKGRLNVGEVNCDVEARLCKDVRLRGYPTILFFKGGERVEYDGLRGLGDFIHYAEKAVDISSGVADVDTESFEALEKTEDVIFVYFYDHATTSEDFLALERLPLSLIGHAKLVKTNDPKLYKRFKITTWPRLLVSREGRPTYYTPLTPRDMRDTNQVLNWMKSVWLPIVPEMTASNAREIMDGRLVVLSILNRQDQESFNSAIREMKSAANEWMDKQIVAFQQERKELRDAKQLRIEEAEDRGDQRALRSAKSIRINMDKSDHKEVGFAWVDGVFWQRWIRTTYGVDVKDGERVLINDEDVSHPLNLFVRLAVGWTHLLTDLPPQNRRYWDQTVTGNYIIPSRTSILETIGQVTRSPTKIKPKLTISSFEKIFFDIRLTFSEHPYLTIGCLLGLAVGGASWFRGRLRRTRGHFRLEENLGMKEMKAPILGANANGKVD